MQSRATISPPADAGGPIEAQYCMLTGIYALPNFYCKIWASMLFQNLFDIKCDISRSERNKGVHYMLYVSPSEKHNYR